MNGLCNTLRVHGGRERPSRTSLAETEDAPSHGTLFIPELVRNREGYGWIREQTFPEARKRLLAAGSPVYMVFRAGGSERTPVNGLQRTLLDKVRTCLRGEVFPAEPLRNHTTYRVGGAAEILARPRTAAEAVRLYRLAKRDGIPLTIIGAGSNVIAPDEGIGGIVVETKDCLNQTKYVERDLVRAAAGVLLSDLARDAAEKGLRGLEPLSCIPGTTGGAVVMNAGTRDGDTARFLERVGVCTSGGRTRVFEARELSFGYRKSILSASDWLVLWAEFRLTPGDPRTSLEAIEALREERNRKYPLEAPSAGSVFKRPLHDYAGRLIEMCGCKGMRIGDAVVSDRHANFIVNAGSARASDIMALIARVRAAVYDKTGIYLELEQVPIGVHVSCSWSPHPA